MTTMALDLSELAAFSLALLHLQQHTPGNSGWTFGGHLAAMALVLGEGLHSIARMAQDEAPSAGEPGVICSTTGST